MIKDGDKQHSSTIAPAALMLSLVGHALPQLFLWPNFFHARFWQSWLQYLVVLQRAHLHSLMPS